MGKPRKVAKFAALMLAFLTVGSTHFNELVNAAISQAVIHALLLKGYSSLMIQCGNSKFASESLQISEKTLKMTKEGMGIEIWTFRPSLETEYKRADIVISHAGVHLLVSSSTYRCINFCRVWHDSGRLAPREATNRSTQPIFAGQSPTGSGCLVIKVRSSEVVYYFVRVLCLKSVYVPLIWTAVTFHGPSQS